MQSSAKTKEVKENGSINESKKEFNYLKNNNLSKDNPTPLIQILNFKKELITLADNAYRSIQSYFKGMNVPADYPGPSSGNDNNYCQRDNSYSIARDYFLFLVSENYTVESIELLIKKLQLNTFALEDFEKLTNQDKVNVSKGGIVLLHKEFHDTLKQFLIGLDKFKEMLANYQFDEHTLSKDFPSLFKRVIDYLLKHDYDSDVVQIACKQATSSLAENKLNQDFEMNWHDVFKMDKNIHNLSFWMLPMRWNPATKQFEDKTKEYFTADIKIKELSEFLLRNIPNTDLIQCFETTFNACNREKCVSAAVQQSNHWAQLWRQEHQKNFATSLEAIRKPSVN